MAVPAADAGSCSRMADPAAEAGICCRMAVPTTEATNKTRKLDFDLPWQEVIMRKILGLQGAVEFQNQDFPVRYVVVG